MRYVKVGTVQKRKGLQAWEIQLDYSHFRDPKTEVFVRVGTKKAKKKKT